MPEPELMTYGELAEAYRRALAEIDKLRAALTASVEAWERLAAAHREMAEQIAYKLQTLLDAQHTPTEETP